MKLEISKMTKSTLKTAALSGRRGFTAIEIAMVAAVIAILSLIVLPIFRNRVEDAKIAAAQADLNALMKAEQVVKADTDAYARLEDLDNVQLNGYTAAPPNGVDKEVPFFKYIAPVPATVPPDLATRHLMLNDAERTQFAGTQQDPKWKGPYIAFQRYISYADLRGGTVNLAGQYLLRSSAGGGPAELAAIQDFPGGAFHDSDQNRIPVDPWGNPYMFFPPTGNSADPTNVNAAASCVIYSLGPNGQPGDGSRATDPTAYRRETALAAPTDLGLLGKDDDLMVEF
jgi:prepilin-type N-terminal cleavage/methylation domain-containing protein